MEEQQQEQSIASSFILTPEDARTHSEMPPLATTENQKSTANITTALSQSASNGFLASLKLLFGHRSFTVFLITSWIMGIFGYIIGSYRMLFLRDILLDYVLVGFLISLFMLIDSIARFVGGYIGDNVNRKWLSVCTMLFLGTAQLIFAFAQNFMWLLLGFIVLGCTSLFGSGSTSYIYDTMPAEQSGLGIGLFQTGAGFGLIGLVIITWILGQGTPFLGAVQFMFLLGGIAIITAGVIRALWLAPSNPIHHENRAKSTFIDFFHQNKYALSLMVSILPVFVGILLLDAFSDGFYRFVSMYYLNETLAFSIGEISLMLIIVLAASIPLSIVVGGFFDRHGSRRTIFVVYSVMPLVLILLLLAPLFPYWLPLEIIAPLISTYPILLPLFSTAFIAIACKGINDILWGTVIFTYLRRAFPRSETAKMLSIFFIIILLAGMATPLPASILYTLFGAFPVLLITLGINFGILAILIFANIEPRVETMMTKT